MKKGIVIAVIAAVVLLIGGISISNKLVSLDEKTKSTWGDVETQYQRRVDLIPNLIETVNKSTSYEKDVLTAVVEARAKATSVQVDASKLTPDQIQSFQDAQAGLSSSLGRLLVSVEKYPDLKANQSIIAFQSQLEGTENRIANARYNFNQSVQAYNTAIQKFPASLIASFSGKAPKGYFKSESGADKAPKVKFD